MKKSIRSFITTTPLALAAALTFSACDDEPSAEGPALASSVSEITPLALGMGDDWTVVEPGVWTRTDSLGDEHVVAIGEAGRAYAIASLEEVEDDLKAIFAADEREETRRQLEELDEYITDLRTSEEPPPSDVSLRCTPSLSTTVDAYPSYCGVSAKASASYSHCSNWGTVRSYAQAACGYESKSHICGPKTGSQVSCDSTVSINGPGPCNSFASAQINAPGVFVFVTDQNYQRGSCSDNGGPPPGGDLCGICASGKDCHCGDVCRPINMICP